MLLDLRRRVFTHVQRLPLAFHERYTSGRTISRLTSDVDALAELLDEGLDDLVTALFSVVTIGVVLLVLDPPLGLVALLGFPRAAAGWPAGSSATPPRPTGAPARPIAALIVQFIETFGGIRAVQAFRREPRNDELHDGAERGQPPGQRPRVLADRRLRARGHADRQPGHRRRPRRTARSGCSTATSPSASLMSFLLYLRRFFDPLQDVAMFYNSYQSATAALEKLSGVLEEEPTVAEPARPGRRCPGPRGELAFDGVRFGYPDRTVLPRLDLRVPAGQTVALVGATGAGKSTLARLMARFYDPVDGRDPAGRRAAGPADRRRPAPRRGHGDPGELPVLRLDRRQHRLRPARRRPATEIEAAARAIGAHEFIDALPDGYDTDVRQAAAAGSRPGSGSWSASPGPSWPTRRC